MSDWKEGARERRDFRQSKSEIQAHKLKKRQEKPFELWAEYNHKQYSFIQWPDKGRLRRFANLKAARQGLKNAKEGYWKLCYNRLWIEKDGIVLES